MTVELDEKALEAAAKAHYESELFSYGWSDVVDSHKKLSALRAAITAYLAAAARPTPDAAAMEREFVTALKEYGRATRYAEHHHANHARKGDFEGMAIDAENVVIDLYRKAVQS